MDLTDLCETIELLCKQHGVSISKMLEDSAAGKNLLDNMRRGSNPNVFSILRIAQYFGVSMDYLLNNNNINPHTAPERDPFSTELELLAFKLTAEQKQFLIAQMKVLLQEK